MQPPPSREGERQVRGFCKLRELGELKRDRAERKICPHGNVMNSSARTRFCCFIALSFSYYRLWMR